MAAVLSAASLPSCTPAPAPATLPPPAAPPPAPTASTLRLSGEIFASQWSVIALQETPQQLAAGGLMVPVINATLSEVERQVSSWRRDSELSKVSLNRSALPQPVPPSTAELVATCVDVGDKTGGAFDITIQPLLALWGFTAETKGNVTAPPSAEAVAIAKGRLGKVKVAGGSVIKSNADVIVDVSAIADGAAAKAIAAALSERGFENFLVDVAGEVVVRGHGEKGPWKLGINTPTSEASPQDTVALVSFSEAQTSSSTMALSTSGTSRDHWELDGKRYSHILDPRSGAPVTHNLVSCTITGPDLVVADALSTACIVMDETETTKRLGAFPGYEAYFVHDDGGTLRSTHTEGFPLAPKP